MFRIRKDPSCLSIQIVKEVAVLLLPLNSLDEEEVTRISTLDLLEISPEVQCMEVTMEEVVTEVTGEVRMTEDTVVDLLHVETSTVLVLAGLVEVTMEDSEVVPSLPIGTGTLPMMNIFNILNKNIFNVLMLYCFTVIKL